MASFIRMTASTKTVIKFSALLETKRGIFRKVSVIGVPFDKGQFAQLLIGINEEDGLAPPHPILKSAHLQQKPGVAKAPQHLRQAGLISALQSVNLHVQDVGDLLYEPIQRLKPMKNYHNIADVAACQKELSKHVQEIVSQGEMCLTVGGDHSISVGSITGSINALGDKLPIVLWVDAHADINTLATSPSGNAHGMPVALLLKETAEAMISNMPAMEWLVPKLSVKDIGYIGLRDVDDGERNVLCEYGIVAYSAEEVERYSVSQVVLATLEKLDPTKSRPIHLTFDIDSLDALEAPATGTPVRGGLSLREGLQIVEEVYRTKRLASFDIVEVNPEISDERGVQLTVEAAIQLCRAAVGYTRRAWPDPSSTDDKKSCDEYATI